MLNSKPFLTVDFGAGTLKIAEFEQNEAGGLRLRQYGIRPLGLEGAQESTREAAVLRGLQDLLAERAFQSKVANVCAPGFHVFSKFVKLPPVDTSKVTQIIQYEAQQNVPFPLEEVVWDYQILGTSPSGELEVLLVAIKTDVVEGLFRVAEGAGLKVEMVDVSPAALCNAFRYNYPDLDGCTMLLDIGAKTSNLLFFEKEKVYSRSINIGANAITQDFATETKMSFGDAEQFKVAEGFVSLGGAYEEPENPNQAAVSKIARQVMTRLHMQVNQTINFYRSQQGGSMPQRLFLSGGASIMPYMAQFFAEKLNLSVDYFNPFRNIEIDQDLNLEELAAVAHSLGEVVGLSLRNLAHCPVELNLMPRSSLQRQQFGEKKPYLAAAVFSLVLAIFGIGWVYGRVAAIREAAINDVSAQLRPLQEIDSRLSMVKGNVDRTREEIEQISGLAERRVYWAGLLMELQRIFRDVELASKAKFNTDVGVWMEYFLPVIPEASQAGADLYAQDYTQSYEGDGSEQGYSAEGYGMGEAPDPTDAISRVMVLVRGVNISAPMNNDIAFSIQAALQASGLFDSDGVQLGDIRTEQPPHAMNFGGSDGSGMTSAASYDENRQLTFVLQMSLKLKEPFKL